MIQRNEWIDLAELWRMIGDEIGSRLVDQLDTSTRELLATGRVQTCPNPNESDDPDCAGATLYYHVGDVRKFLKRLRGRPKGSTGSRLKDQDAPVALLARAKIAAGASQPEAIRAAIAEFEANGIAVYAEPMTARTSTEKRIAGRLADLQN